MTKNAGHLSAAWIAACRSNEGDTTLENWICHALNVEDAEVDADGAVWARGHWLTQDECEQLMAKINEGA